MILEVKCRLYSVFWKLSLILKRFQHGSRSYQLYVCVCLLTFCASGCYWLMFSNATLPSRALSFRLVQNALSSSMGHAGDEGCEFPELDPFSEEAARFRREPPGIECGPPDWVYCWKSECRLKDEILKQYRDVTCTYKDIVYVDDENYHIGRATRARGDGRYSLNRSDHVKVSCKGISKQGLGVLYSRWHGHKAGFRPMERRVPEGRRDALQVLVLAFDSTSRLGFIRAMPRSRRVLEDELRATVLQGFHVLGDGTPATLFPLLSGRSELEHPDARKVAQGGLLDPQLFIFDVLKEYGYRTAYFEDSPWIGSFQYRYRGFRAQPADHYLRAFLLAQWHYGILHTTGSKYCVGDTPQHQLMLNLTRQFMEFEGKKFCFNFIADISHDDFNLITTADGYLAEYLRELRTSGILKDTLLIVMGDHGSRYSPFRETYQGKMEERLPLLAMVLPEKLLERRPEALAALRHNARVLTTPFDVHTTLMDVLGLRGLANEYRVPGSDLPRGMSLLEKIPKSRSCGQAAILPHWCVCVKWSNVSLPHAMHTRAAVALARFVNDVTKEQRELCVERTLTSVELVLRQASNPDVLRFRRGREGEGVYEGFVTRARGVTPYVENYQAKIVMAPGRAVFEGTMKYFPRTDRFDISAGDVSRITAYGDEPKCVSATHPHLNKFCYCKNTEELAQKNGELTKEEKTVKEKITKAHKELGRKST